MSMSQHSACHFVPLLARIVLGAAFITAGYGKVFTVQEFDRAKIDALERESDVDLDIDADETDGDADETDGDADEAADGDLASSHRDGGPWEIRLASLSHQQSPPPPTGGGRSLGETLSNQGEELGEAFEQGEDALQDPDDPGDLADPDAAQPPTTAASGETIPRKKLYGVAIMLHDAGWTDYTVQLAWLAALTELIGGALILVGLFARVWGLGLAITMAVAFYITTLPGLLDGPMAFMSVVPQFNQMFSQLGLFVLAFGIFLTGAGAVSLDRMLFKSGREDIDVDLT